MKKRLTLLIILIIDIISLIPSPLIYMASMMSAAGQGALDSKFHEILIRLLWILFAHYPVYIILTYILGRVLLNKKNNVKGYLLCLSSAIISLAVILILIKAFIH